MTSAARASASLQRSLLLAASAALVLLAAPAVAAAACAPGYSDEGNGLCSRTYFFTGAPVPFTVPAGVSVITADVAGAQGGTSREEGVGAASDGGLGGRQVAQLPVTPGSQLTILVGQAGADGGVLGFGGYGGGGHASSTYAGSGGGGSFVFGPRRVRVAAGGGGGGGFDYNPMVLGRGNQQAPGGAGAGAIAAGDGASVRFCCNTGWPPIVAGLPGGGKGATPSAPGAGGVPDEPNGSFGPSTGQTGSGPATGPAALGEGGDSYPGNASSGGIGFAGGGGGGYYGGGGGGSIEFYLEGGGGGGGAGHVSPGATAGARQVGVHPGNGQVTISYVTSGSPPSLTLSPQNVTATQFEQRTFSATVSSPGGAGRQVIFSVAGVHPRAPVARTTNAVGTATFTLRSRRAGDDVVTACYDVAADGACGASDPVKRTNVHWNPAPNLHALTATKAGGAELTVRLYCSPAAKPPVLRADWRANGVKNRFSLTSSTTGPVCLAAGTPPPGANFTTAVGSGAGTLTTGATAHAAWAQYQLADRTGDGAADTVYLEVSDGVTYTTVLSLMLAPVSSGGLVAEGTI